MLSLHAIRVITFLALLSDTLPALHRFLQCRNNTAGADCSIAAALPVIDLSNFPPSGQALPILVGRQFMLNLTVTSGNGGGGSVTWSVASAPFGTRINPLTGMLTWTPRTASGEVITLVITARNEYGSDSVQLRLLPSVDLNCSAQVVGADREFVPGDRIAITGFAQRTAVGNASEPWANRTVQLQFVRGGTDGQSATAVLDAAGNFSHVYAVPPFNSAVGAYQLLCRHPSFTGKR